jgi:hypothetical protein
MYAGLKRRWGVWGCTLFLLLAGGVTDSHALLVDLDAYVQFSIMQADGVTPMPVGSIVYIVGSGDAVNDGMDAVPPGGTNLVADSVLGDDVILGTVQLDASGQFLVTLQYESDDVNYVYIRFFQDTNYPVEGYLYWGTSAVYSLGVTLGVSTVVFDPTTNLVASNRNNFIAVPEASTAGMYLLAAGMLMALRSTVRRGRAEKARGGGGT